MRKKQTFTIEHDSSLDLKSVIHQHALFFDKLVDLIPPKFYLPNDDTEKPWFQGLSKAEKAAAKKESIENIKKARRDRLDPEKPSSTTELLKHNLEKEKLKDGGDDGDAGVKFKMSGLEDDDRSVTYEELRQRLRRRIEELHGNRNNGNSDKATKKKEKSKKQERQQNKRRRDNESEKRDNESEKNEPTSNTVEKDVEEATRELTFSHVKLGNEEEHGKKKKKKFSKLTELDKATKLEEAKKDPENGDVVSKKHAWKAATSRAAGIKVHDNPKLLRESIKKGKKRHQKNVKKWKERVETIEKMKAEKQKTRAENIAERIHQKKMRRIEKREKKLLRPGFEGRKEGFINEGNN